MGEIADMMLEGVLCECCGEALHYNENQDEDIGIPMYCSPQCAKDRGIPKKEWPYRIAGYGGVNG